MRIIKKDALVEFWQKHPESEASLSYWFELTRSARWENLEETRKTFPHADSVRVESGRKTVVFNIGGNKFRLISAIHYNHKRVYVLRILTHNEYTQGNWKDSL